MTDPLPTESRVSTAALVTYIVLAIFTATVVGVFALVFTETKVQDALLSLLGTVVSAAIGGAGIAWGFWLNSSASSQKKDATIAQIAGAGPPPPAAPLSSPADEAKP